MQGSRGVEGLRILVTGGSSGIGRSTVLALVAGGAKVIAFDCNAEGLATLPEAVVTCRVDVTRQADVEDACEAILSSHGGLDGLVNAAGGSGRAFGDGPLDQCTGEGWARTLDLNLTSVYHVCHAALPLLRAAGGGSIVNVSSVLALLGHEMFATHAYAAAKGGMIALSRAMAVRYARERIRVNVICPGLIRTPMSRRAQQDPAVLEIVPRLHPLTGDFGEPEDVAACAQFLLGRESRLITGATIPVDAGWSAQ